MVKEYFMVGVRWFIEEAAEAFWFFKILTLSTKSFQLKTLNFQESKQHTVGVQLDDALSKNQIELVLISSQ